jgi:hypothetical protein
MSQLLEDLVDDKAHTGLDVLTKDTGQPRRHGQQLAAGIADLLLPSLDHDVGRDQVAARHLLVEGGDVGLVMGQAGFLGVQVVLHPVDRDPDAPKMAALEPRAELPAGVPVGAFEWRVVGLGLEPKALSGHFRQVGGLLGIDGAGHLTIRKNYCQQD